jgi:hypothetical protein
MPLIAKIVVQAKNTEIAGLGQGEVPGEAADVADSRIDVSQIATGEATVTTEFIRQRHVLIPQLLHKWIDSNSTWIANSSWQ